MSNEVPAGATPAQEVPSPQPKETPHAAPSQPAATNPNASPPAGPSAPTGGARSRKPLLFLAGAAVLAMAVWYARPWFERALNTVSTDDAYVSDYVTFVAPRVPGQVLHVNVIDNNRVHKDDVLVELDPEPYQVQVDIAAAAVASANADLVAARANTRGNVGKARSLRFNLMHTVEQVDNQIALLRANVATYESQKAALLLAQANNDRNTKLIATNSISREEYDQTKSAWLIAKAQVDQALEGVHQTRVALGLPATPPDGKPLTDVPDDLDETFSTVREAQAQLMEAAAQLGVEVTSYDLKPKEMIQQFMNRDPKHDIDRIYDKIVLEAPAVKQAEAKLLEAQRNLDQAKLNLRYCRVLAEIDGVVSRRNVNPGNNVLAGQQLMALQSTDKLWVDANFKETQLASLRIGQRVELYTDMYGERTVFGGHISGFTMGTGSTIALLPAENATGNFVKVVQRLPVRIEVDKYDPSKAPLFIGLSVTPYVYVKEEPTGLHAGDVLQPYLVSPPAGEKVSGPPTLGAAKVVPPTGSTAEHRR